MRAAAAAVDRTGILIAGHHRNRAQLEHLLPPFSLRLSSLLRGLGTVPVAHTPRWPVGQLAEQQRAAAGSGSQLRSSSQIESKS